MSTFGVWTSPRHVEQAVINHLVLWGPDWIAEAERQFAIPAQSVPVPAAGQFTVVRDVFEKWPEDQTPAVLVIAPGLTGPPRREADRTLTGPVGLGVGVIASSTFPGAGAEVAQIIATAYMNLLLNLKPAGLDVAGVDFESARWGDIPAESERTMGAARLLFTFWVRNWASLSSKPPRSIPSVDPYEDPGDRPTVREGGVFVSITNARST